MSYQPPNGDSPPIRDEPSELALANARLIAEIEERRRTETSLRQSEERFEKAFRLSPDLLVLSRLSDGTILEVNHSWEQGVGYRASEVVGKSGRTLGFFPDLAVREKLVERLIRDGSFRDQELQMRQRSGAIRDVRVSAETITIGGEACALSIIRDITAQKEADRALRATDERLRMALAAAKMGIWEWIIPSNRVIWSAEVSSIFGLASGEAVDTLEAFLECVHPEDRPAFGSRVAQFIAHPPRQNLQLRVSHRLAEWRDPLGRLQGVGNLRCFGDCRAHTGDGDGLDRAKTDRRAGRALSRRTLEDGSN